MCSNVSTELIAGGSILVSLLRSGGGMRLIDSYCIRMSGAINVLIVALVSHILVPLCQRLCPYLSTSYVRRPFDE